MNSKLARKFNPGEKENLGIAELFSSTQIASCISFSSWCSQAVLRCHGTSRIQIVILKCQFVLKETQILKEIFSLNSRSASHLMFSRSRA